MHLAEIFQEAELPDGVVNIVTGARETGKALVEHSDVDKIAFTGSTAVGKFLTQAVAGTKKKLTLELGGKAANIIFEDAADRSGRGRNYLRHLFQPGPRLLRRFAVARAGRNFSGGHSQIARPHLDLARGKSARQKHRHRRDQFADAAG